MSVNLKQDPTPFQAGDAAIVRRGDDPAAVTLGTAAALSVGTTAGTVAAGDHGHGNATTSVAGFMAAADKEKLDGVAAGATANAGTVTSVAATGANGITVTGSPVTSAGTLALGVDAGTLRSHINVANGATANATDAALRDRATHTGTQAISTVDGLQAALDARPIGTGVTAIVALTQAAYDALDPPAATTLYVITDAA